MRNLLFLALILLSGCVTSSNYNPQKAQLQPNEGLLLTNLGCTRDHVVGIFKSGYKTTGKTAFNKTTFGAEATLNCYDTPLKIVPLEEGDYFIGSLGGAMIHQNSAYNFTIHKGHINYIGDIVRDSSGRRYGNTTYIKVSMGVSDKTTITKNMLKETMPELAHKYPFKKSLAKKRKRSVEEIKAMADSMRPKDFKPMTNKEIQEMYEEVKKRNAAK